MTQLNDDFTATGLPPIGEAIGTPLANQVVERIYTRRQAIINALAKPRKMAATCRKVVNWGEDVDFPDDIKTIVNKIRIACETQVANHLKEPAKVTIEGVETGEYSDWYWCGPPQRAAEVPIQTPVVDQATGQALADPMTGQPAMQTTMGLDPMYVGNVAPSGQVFPPLPLPAQMVQYLQMLGQQGVIDPQFICRLDDEFTAKTIQKQFDEDWREAKADKWLRSRVWANTVEGWQLPLYEFDQQTKQHILRRNSIDQTYIDQSCEDIDDAVEAGIDLYLDYAEAMALYPKQHQTMSKYTATTGGLNPPGTDGVVPVQYRGQFNRPMVPKIVWWLRNQPVGLQAALDAGLVEQRSVPDEQAIQNQAIQGAQQEQATQPVLDSQPAPDNGPSGDNSGSNAFDGATGSAQPQQLPIPVRSAYFLAGTNTEVTPGAPGWPTAIAQYTIIYGELVEDVICPLPDIPILHMRNSIVIGLPWGIGEPFHTKKLQDVYSGITHDAARHAHAIAFPAVLMDDAVKQSMEKEFGYAFLQPDMVVGIPNNLNKPLEQIIHVVQAPPFPESSVKIREMIGEDFNQVSGRPDVLAGNTPTQNASGRMVSQLQAAAVEPLQFKSQEIAYMVEKLAGLMIFAILNFKSRQSISGTVSVPEPLLELVLQRARSKPPNLKATISSGAGSVIERKRAQMLQWNQMVDPADGTPIADGQTTREVLGLDAASVERRNQQAKRQAMLMAPQPAPGQEDQQQQDAQPSNNGSSNGRFGHG